ncbi:hypothetical protein EJD97_023227 [Solanum chilense]|uniref:Uncharacterized protein n=1 Tax=Solanum chilense TaxID=4083 RepID=A0A6N2C5V4_SOLCI|nr:hypothetical protein EJD97_023227 [Solanum chilense]
MNSRRNATQSLEEEIVNASAPPHGDQVPPVEEEAYMEQASVNPPLLMDGDIRDDRRKLDQACTYHAQAMTDQANREIIPDPYQQFTHMASHLTDFTHMNPLTLYGLNVVYWVFHKDYRSSWGDSMTWEIFTKAFIDRFFLRDMREAKVVDFIKLL